MDVATLSVIRRWALREQLSIREIARRSGLSRNTIKKYLACGIVEPRYAKRVNASKLDAYACKLSDWLKAQQSKGRKQERTLLQMHADLVALGFDGSYGRVAAFARAWRQRQHEAEQTAGRGTFVPLDFAPGEAFQFDWSEDWAVIGGERVKLQVAHTKLSHSWALHLRAAAMASHYLFEPEFCNPASGWEKGQVEKNVRDARHRLWQRAPGFTTLDELNDWLELRCKALWAEIKHASGQGSVAEVWALEQACLMQAARPFDGFVEHPKRVSPTCLVHFERDRYSVPASFANRLVSLHAYAARLTVVAEGRVLCEHTRVFLRNHNHPGQTVYDWRHYLAVL